MPRTSMGSRSIGQLILNLSTRWRSTFTPRPLHPGKEPEPDWRFWKQKKNVLVLDRIPTPISQPVVTNPYQPFHLLQHKTENPENVFNSFVPNPLHAAQSFFRSYPFLDSQEIPRILRNPKVLYRIYNLPPPILILCQLNSVRVPLQPNSWKSILILSSLLHLVFRGPPAIHRARILVAARIFWWEQVQQYKLLQCCRQPVSPLFSVSHSTITVVATSVSLLLATV